jgi:hypothetical protein
MPVGTHTVRKRKGSNTILQFLSTMNEKKAVSQARKGIYTGKAIYTAHARHLARMVVDSGWQVDQTRA